MFLLCTALLAAVAAAADSITPSNETAVLSSNGSINIQFAKGSQTMTTLQLISLTDDSRALNATITGTPIVTTLNNSISLSDYFISFISCDPSDGFITPGTVFTAAQRQKVPAVVFYSNYSEYCTLRWGQTTSRVYSTKSKNDSRSILGMIRDPADPYYAIIATPSTPSNSTSPDNGPLGPSPTTAVAMIVLYAITGVITLLFLMIIVTGAIRAHRHPERYGPRNGRRTRAGGLARAVLDSIPVVKFGERQPPKDVELAPAVEHGTPEVVASSASASKEASSSTEAAENEKLPTVAEASSSQNAAAAAAAAVDGIAAADLAQAAESNDHGCSICTEDFELGQDQRVLPCDHRFHPACVDPWLLNVSGTCPLCRIDLTKSDEEVPADETPRNRRSVLMAITGLRRLDGMSRDERISALRRYRFNRASRAQADGETAEATTSSETAGLDAHASTEQDAEGERRAGRRLSRILNVRTWRTTS